MQYFSHFEVTLFHGVVMSLYSSLLWNSSLIFVFHDLDFLFFELSQVLIAVCGI